MAKNTTQTKKPEGGAHRIFDDDKKNGAEKSTGPGARAGEIADQQGSRKDTPQRDHERERSETKPGAVNTRDEGCGCGDGSMGKSGKPANRTTDEDAAEGNVDHRTQSSRGDSSRMDGDKRAR